MRLEARMKMGYYPTPPTVVDRVKTFLDFPEAPANVLDPCCGEGLALRRLVEGSDATTYGVEPDQYRAEQATDVLDHVLKCGIEDARISHSAFGCLYLNPPYDWEEGGEFASERKEKAFLKGTARYLAPDSVLVYVVPQHIVRGDVARLLAYRFQDFNAYRFPDKEYEPFNQVVVLGRKKGEPSIAVDDFDRLAAVPGETLDVIPFLDAPVYTVPAGRPVDVFRSLVIDEAELEKSLEKSRLWSRLRVYGNGSDGLGRPPLPLHSGHLGLMLASGYLDGVVGEGDDRHIVRGKVEKHTYTESEYQEEVKVDREIETYRVSIKVLKRNGDIETLM